METALELRFEAAKLRSLATTIVDPRVVTDPRILAEIYLLADELERRAGELDWPLTPPNSRDEGS